MKWSWVSQIAIAVFLLPLAAHAQTKPPDATPPPNAAPPATCPVQLLKFDPSWVRIRVRNVSGKTIVGLVFNAALADPTEHWKWLHWNFDLTRPLRDFNWDKAINSGETKTLHWDSTEVDFPHGGGGAFVLRSALFEDGTAWEEPEDAATCKLVWYGPHKKSFFKPVVLPPRQ